MKINANGIDIYYEIHGEGQPLVLIPGFSVDHTVWFPIVEELAKSYQVIVYDNRGTGQSSCPDQPYTIEMLALDVLALCEALKIDKAHFLGHSMGGAIAQYIAYHHPERVKSIILENTMTKIDYKYALFSKAQHQMIKLGTSLKTLAEATFPWIFTSDYLQRNLNILLQLTLANPYPITAIGYGRQLEALMQFDSTSWISEINAPCLILGSNYDLIVHESNLQDLAKLVSHAEYYCFENMGHAPHIERPEKFCKLVLKFLAKYN